MTGERNLHVLRPPNSCMLYLGQSHWPEGEIIRKITSTELQKKQVEISNGHRVMVFAEGRAYHLPVCQI